MNILLIGLRKFYGHRGNILRLASDYIKTAETAKDTLRIVLSTKPDADPINPDPHTAGEGPIPLPYPIRFAFLNLRRKSLVRGTVLMLGSLALALIWSGFPASRATPKLILPALLSLWGTWETSRCLQVRWSFYHGGVLLLLYADVIAIAMIMFLLLYPYASWLL